MVNPTFKLNYGEFNATLDKYVQFHRRRSAPSIVNKKALFIARGAIRETQRPSPTVIGKELSEIVYDFSGKRKKLTSRTTFGSFGQALSAPVAALLINFRRGKSGEKGLYGSEMKDAIQRLISRSNSARAFLASGWIQAVKKLSPLVRDKKNLPAEDNEAKKIGNRFGSARPATSGTEISVATIINDSLSRFTTTPKAEVWEKAARGLQKAIDKERISMEQNIKDEMQKAAKSLGIKSH